MASGADLGSILLGNPAHEGSDKYLESFQHTTAIDLDDVPAFNFSCRGPASAAFAIGGSGIA